jgi:hypothetical protein
MASAEITKGIPPSSQERVIRANNYPKHHCVSQKKHFILDTTNLSIRENCFGVVLSNDLATTTFRLPDTIHSTADNTNTFAKRILS